MPLSPSLASYEDARAIMDAAAESTKGVKVPFPSRGKAIQMRQRCYKFRVLTRAENAKIYPATHPMHNSSVYEDLHITIADSVLFVQKVSAEALKIEELS